jgi:putative transposase
VAIVSRPEDYAWSSYRCFIGQQERPNWLVTDFVLSSISTIGKEATIRYQQFVEDRIGGYDESPLRGAVASTILGTEKFVQSMASKHLGHRSADRNVPAVKGITGRWTIEQITAAVNAVIDDDYLRRKVSTTLCHRYSGARLKEVGSQFGISDAAVAQTSCRVRKRAINDESVSNVLEKVLNLLKGGVKVEI